MVLPDEFITKASDFGGNTISLSAPTRIALLSGRCSIDAPSRISSRPPGEQIFKVSISSSFFVVDFGLLWWLDSHQHSSVMPTVIKPDGFEPSTPQRKEHCDDANVNSWLYRLIASVQCSYLLCAGYASGVFLPQIRVISPHFMPMYLATDLNIAAQFRLCNIFILYFYSAVTEASFDTASTPLASVNLTKYFPA